MSQNRSRNWRKPQQFNNNNNPIIEEVEKENEEEEEEEEEEEAPLRYAPLRDFYGATSSLNGTAPLSPPLVHVYSRRRPNITTKPSFFDSLVSRFAHNYDDSPSALVSVKSEPLEEEEENEDEEEDEAEPMDKEEQKKENKTEKMKRKREELSKKWLRPKREPTRMDADTTELRVQNGNKGGKSENVGRKRKHGASENGPKADGNGVVDSTAKKWVRLSFEGVDPAKFIGLQSKIYWPLDDDWYGGHIVGYNAETGRHQVSYEDGDKENVMLSVEKIKFHISPDEMQRLNLKYSTAAIADGLDFSEMVVLAAGFDDDHDLGRGDIIWAKLAGHAVWPAVIVDDSVLVNRKGLNRISDGKSFPVQFFGTHDFARVNAKQVISFLKGLLSSFHLKCKKPNFLQSLEEAKTYLSEQHLPERMLIMQNGEKADNCDFSGQEDEENYNSSEDCNDDKEIRRKLYGSRTCLIEIGDLRVIRLGSIVKYSKFFQDGKYIWPEGYTATRKFSSIKDPSVHALYKMEVLRDVDSKLRPLFRVTVDGEQFKGSTPTACWDKIYKRIRTIQPNSDGLTNEGQHGSNKRLSDSGSEMFGFSNPEVMKLIKEMSISKNSSRSFACKSISRSSLEVPVGYRPVQVKWKDLDKCSVCHMDEEYEDNLFLQCDRCRIMVHAKCYGELEPVDGVLWLCNLCRPGAPKYYPSCCLCPVRGGAMKPTTDGRWAHIACAIWIPESFLLDIKKMEPIDGLSRISKDRWKLLCSICGVSYGACIQCSKNSCRVAYHPLCARAAGFCIEPADEDKLHLINMDEDEDKQCIQLHSFCKKHSPPSRDRLKAENRSLASTQQVLENIPPSNPSGCARTEPFNFIGRRGRKEPDALAAASLKRLFVEDKPYLVRGFCRHDMSVDGLSSAAFSGSNCRIDVPSSIHSMIEKFRYMRTTTRKRLAFGKSGIHGFGIFAKQPHRAGDMVIEYTGELVRPSIADRREHLIYNSLVGAGTYMFRIDNERVIDATRAGSIAHLINHSCEPNCYSRVITVNGDEHIIIFAKRDIKPWEELTYDYRFMSIDEQLPCYCGHPRCRGVVNDIEAEELVAKLLVPSSELTELRVD